MAWFMKSEYMDMVLVHGIQHTPHGVLRRLMAISRIGHALFVQAEQPVGCAELEAIIMLHHKYRFWFAIVVLRWCGD